MLTFKDKLKGSLPDMTERNLNLFHREICIYPLELTFGVSVKLDIIITKTEYQ